MSLLTIVIALIAAVLTFVVLTAFIVFQNSHLIFALIAVAVFLLIAFRGDRLRIR